MRYYVAFIESPGIPSIVDVMDGTAEEVRDQILGDPNRPSGTYLLLDKNAAMLYKRPQEAEVIP